MPSLLQMTQQPPLLDLQPPQLEQQEDKGMRGIGDVAATRRRIFAQAQQAVASLPPMENKRHRLELRDVHYRGPEEYSIADHKRALLTGGALNRQLRGTWVLTDRETGQPLDQKTTTIAKVPYLTNAGTYVHGGNDYTLGNQLRLMSGAFARRKDNGELETHANILPGEGVAHRYFLDPDKSLFYMRVGQAKIPLMPLLRAMGATDDQLRDAWGQEMFAANVTQSAPGLINKYYERLVRRRDPDATPEDKARAVREAMESMRINPEVAKATLGEPLEHMNLPAVLAATRKLLAISRGEAEVDDRDHLAYQSVLGPEDLFAERLSKDHSGLRRQLFNRASWKGNLSSVTPGALTKQVMGALLNSGLGQALEEINPADVLDKRFRISRLGEGGIPSVEAVPDEARAVQPSHFGFIDPLRTPESFKVGVDVFLSGATRKGDDGRIYAPFTDAKTGETVWKSPQDVADLAIAFPHEMSREAKRVFAMQRGRIRAVPKDQVDLVMSHFERAFSPLGNMVPLKSMLKGQRMAMASRMMTQALPLIQPEAPLVQAGDPDGPDSFEFKYGSDMGALRAADRGRVVSVLPDSVVVRYRDGQEKEHELYNNFPYNRKTYIHQTPVVEPGQVVGPGDLLARSNYTDERGVTALGKNARVAYIPFRGMNFEDAIVISQGFANRMSSEHMYQHSADFSKDHKRTRNEFLSLFPGKYDRRQLETIDDNGAVRPGTEVRLGDPLILAAAPRATGHHKVHKRKSRAYQDESVVWKHHQPGVVTDVVEGEKGTTVLVKSVMPMEEGDKLCFDPDTSLLTESGWKRVQDVTESDRLATMNPNTGNLEWHSPDRLHSYHHVGRMYKLQTKHLDMLVTPEHDLWVSRPGEPYRKVKAADFYESEGEWQFQKDCRWVGEEQPVFSPPAYGRASSRDNDLPPTPMDLWLRFLGYYLSEGRRLRTFSNGYQVQISQFKTSDAWQPIADCLDELGLRWSYNESASRFEINSKHLYGLVGDCGDNAYNKRLPDYVKRLSSRQLSILFSYYMDGDGHRGSCWEYGTSSEQLSFDLEVLLLKIGWCGSPRKVERSDNFQKRPHWRTRVNRSHLRPWWKKSKASQYGSVTEEMVDYDGMVYCVTVANHLVYAKRGGKSYWSGNSGRYG